MIVTATLLALLTTQAGQPESASPPAQPPPPTCEVLLDSVIPCHVELWKTFPNTELRDIDSFEELLDGLLDGDVNYARRDDPEGTGADADDGSLGDRWNACLKSGPLGRTPGCADSSMPA